MQWAYGVTTVPNRRDSLLVQTLDSLCYAGFNKPWLFVDGCEDSSNYDFLGLNVVTRFPAIRTFGNWMLSLLELYIRNPHADRYAMFQDDLITNKNLKKYLEYCDYPERGYWNLYTFPEKQELAPSESCWYQSNQLGMGAVALVFNREAVTTLLTRSHMIMRPQNDERGWRAIDGGIVTAFKKAGWQEYVHNPSLVQHTGITSVMGNKQHELAVSFKGEDFDAMELV